jgi:hypothetical protein
MRKIETKLSQEKKSKRNSLIVGAILIFVMVGSTFGIIINSFGNKNSSLDKITYNGHEFNFQNNAWTLTAGKNTLSFVYNPLEVENLSGAINGNLSYLNSYVSLPLYISTKDSYSGSEIYSVLSPFVERVQIACYSDEACDSNIPTKDCTSNFIIIRESNASSIYQNNKCVFITGQKQDLIKLTDLYLFKMLGIQ